MNESILEIGQDVDNSPLIIKPHISWTASGLSHAFPNSAPAAKRRIKELKQQVFALQDKERFYCSRNPEVEFYVNFVNIDRDIFLMMSHIEFLEKYVRLCGRTIVEKGKLDIARAKQYPIPDIIEVNRSGFASCPLHSDTNPSLKYYKSDNTWWCHQCSTGGDVIDLVQAIRGCSLQEAVKFLS